MTSYVSFSNPDLPLVCVQGAGFVGSAMAVAVASARGDAGEPRFNVAAVELDSDHGRGRIAELNGGTELFSASDPRLREALLAARSRGNLVGVVDQQIYRSATVAIVDVNLDVQLGDAPRVEFGGFRKAIAELANRLPAGALILIETTVPPGTCEQIVLPTVADCLARRGMPQDALLVAHSYERVMPGVAYMDSIVNFWRVYSGATQEAADACQRFLSRVIDTKAFPLTRVSSMTASETGKVLENSYRATTIAFMEEWSRFAERANVDLFPVIDAIRVRPTHSNMRQPGFGVGGYCLTKDPLLVGIGARDLLGFTDLQFPFSEQAVAINRQMPLETLRLVREGLGGVLDGRTVLLLGVSYRPDVSDTRYSPSETFVRVAREAGADVDAFDPLVTYWDELSWSLPLAIPDAASYDAVVFASAHQAFTSMDVAQWLGDARPLVIDANRVLSDEQRASLRRRGVPVASIGRGAEFPAPIVAATLPV